MGGQYSALTLLLLHWANASTLQTLSVWTMQCIGYKRDLQQYLVNNYEAWQRTQPAPNRRKRKPQGSNTKSTPRKRQRTVKKEEEEKEEDEAESEDGDEDEEDEEEDDLEVDRRPVYIPRGTRSRPIAV
jgi:hypothetical protein